MKINLHLLKIAGVTMTICATNAVAAPVGPYLNLDLGSSLVEDVTIKGPSGFKATFDPGICATICAGYHFNNWLGAEFETGVIWNSIDKVNGFPLRFKGATADLYQVPFKVNLVINVPTKTRWTPYIGGGCGVMATFLDSQVDPVPAQAVDNPIGNENFSDMDLTFVYQVIAGLKFDISEQAQIDVGYKFFGTFDHSWSDHGRSFETEGIYTHAFLVSFTWRF